MKEIIRRFRRLLWPEELMPTDDFVIIRATHEYTEELAAKIWEADALTDNIKKMLKGVHRTLATTKIYHNITKDKYKSLVEQGQEEEIQKFPAAALKVFSDGKLRVLNIKDRNGIITIEDLDLSLKLDFFEA